MNIAIYKYGTETYTEAALPTFFGPVTGIQKASVAYFPYAKPHAGRTQSPTDRRPTAKHETFARQS